MTTEPIHGGAIVLADEGLNVVYRYECTVKQN